MNRIKCLGAVMLLLAAPASAQSVRDGIEAWQKGDHAGAIAAWTPLAAAGDGDAAFNLGQAYRLGKGVPVNLPRAQQYLEQAARRGHVDAATTLGILLFQNNDRAAAIRWLRQAAEAGEPRAMLLYGTALYNGDGVAADPITAYAYVSRAAAQGLDVARAALADLDRSMPLEQRRKGLTRAKFMAAAGASAPSKPAASAKAAPSVAKPKPVVAAAPTSGGGGWRIQLGAFGQRASAEALFARVRGKVGARQAYYVPAGKVVRLQIGPYDSRAAAAAGCASLGGQACYPVAAR